MVTLQVDNLQERRTGTLFSPPVTTTYPRRLRTMEKGGRSSSRDEAPEKRLTLFALRLAVLEKVASGLGALGFAWATVVLLGGFAGVLRSIDFWFVTVILVIEGARIFSRSHELEWQQHSTWSSGRSGWIRGMKSSLKDFKSSLNNWSGRKSDRRSGETDLNVMEHRAEEEDDVPKKLRRTWNSSEVSLLPYTGWFTLSKHISRLLYLLQLLTAMTCVVLSLMRLIMQDYDKGRDPDDTRNMNGSLDIFYALALAEALLSLLEKAYWQWKVKICNLLVEVNISCGFDDTEEDMVHINRFFYDAYSRCLDGSIFDGLKMDLVSFSEELLESESSDEQFIGARILQRFVTKEKFAADTLRKIGTSTKTMERLVDMLSWKNPEEEAVRLMATEIVLQLSKKKQNALRVAEIPGSITAISSLLYSAPAPTTTSESGSSPHEITARRAIPDERNYEYSAFNRMGLRILKYLAYEHDNCSKIGYTRGLLQKVIDFTGNAERVLGQTHTGDTQIKCTKYALMLVKTLVRAPGNTGRELRAEISENIFSISNLRDILRYGENHKRMQKLAIEILTSLGMDDDATDRIGCTGGIMRELFGIFFSKCVSEDDDQNLVRAEAGEALMMLTVDSEANCRRVLRMGKIKNLVEALEDPFLAKSSARILRNLCTYSGPDDAHRLRGTISATKRVLRMLMHEQNHKMLEVAIGLATRIFMISPSEAREEFKNAGIDEEMLARRVVKILNENKEPNIQHPRMRRFVIELAVWMMESNDGIKVVFGKAGLWEELVNVAETTSELEFFLLFSGSTGVSRLPMTMHDLVHRALEILGKDWRQHD